jgi:hypothetical protein
MEVAHLPVGKLLRSPPCQKVRPVCTRSVGFLTGLTLLTPQMSDSPSRVYTRYEVSDEAILLCGVSPVGRASAILRSQKVHSVCTRVVYFLAGAFTFRWPTCRTRVQVPGLPIVPGI